MIKNASWLKIILFKTGKNTYLITHTLLVGSTTTLEKSYGRLIIIHAITAWPSNCTLGIFISEKWKLTFIINLHMNVYGSFSHNNPKLEAARMSFTRLRVRHTVVHQTTRHCSAIRRNKPWRYTNSYVKWKKPIPRGYRLLYTGFHSYVIFEMTKL